MSSFTVICITDFFALLLEKVRQIALISSLKIDGVQTKKKKKKRFGDNTKI